MCQLSICIITKNESENLKHCLSRLRDHNRNGEFEVVVVDTGSTDDSREIAMSMADKVCDFEWCDDFSKARNFAVSKADGDYVIVLDTDEFVDEFDIEGLKKLIRKHPGAIGRIHLKNLYQCDGTDMCSNELVSRLFPKALYHYEGRIHEQIVRISPTPEDSSGYEAYSVPLYATHVGYQGNKNDRALKAQRNLKLLLQELEDKGDDPYILYQIGKSYFYEQSYAEAIPYLERAMELPLDMRLSYVHGIVTTYGYCLIYTKQYANAMMLEGVYDDFKQDADYLFVLGLIYMYNARFENAINAFLGATLIPECTVDGVNSYSAYHNVGVILECLGDKQNALTYYRKCGSYAPALEGIQRCKNI